MLAILHLILFELSVTQQPTISRGQDFTLPLEIDGAGGPWGLGNRNADHATLAINSNLDILVAYQTSRLDVSPSLDLKQVEAQLFRWNGNDTWTRVGVMRLGDIRIDPVGRQPEVRCERPDVIANGSRFFVTWTRRYDANYDPPGTEIPYPEGPAILEGAWIQEESGAGWKVYDSGTTGLGIELDRDQPQPGGRKFWIRECAGVPDVVALRQDTVAGSATVGIAYPHQSDFGDWAQPPQQPDYTRECELRFVTCTLTGMSNAAETHDQNPFILKSAIQFNGLATDDAGFILPDLAPSAPSLPDSTLLFPRFVMAYEEQFNVGPTLSDVDGRIRVAQWEWNGVSWVEGPAHSFGSANPLAERRRGTVNAFPANLGATDVDNFSISFNVRAVGSSDRDVIYKEWILSPVFSGPAAWAIGAGWDNSPSEDHLKPVPLHARDGGPGVGKLLRCAAELLKTTGKSDLLEYDLISDLRTPIVSDRYLGRPAYAYAYGTSNNVVLTWEEHSPNAGDPSRIHILVR